MICGMSRLSNIVPFPSRARPMHACPHCGTQTDLWRIGRLLWGYCDDHEVRWVVADLRENSPVGHDVDELRRRLERLSRFIEVTH